MYICKQITVYLQIFYNILYFFKEKSGKIIMVEFVVDLFENIKRALLSFGGISDLLDVLAVALMIYSIIKLLRGTRAMQLFKGLFVLAVVYLFVSLFDMQTSEYILNFIFSNLLIILVVIFTPEIRHMFESVGRGSVSITNLLNFKNNDDEKLQEEIKNSVNCVCKSCADMRDKQIGALIVFERESLLSDIIKTGTMLDATVTTELIGNIFFPKAPMHDGAVVIKNGRVVSAGCILPLTNNNTLSRELGTRHRAAVGMSEVSDAIVVVVSEETGAISFAEKGVLKRGISDGDLREILMNKLIDEGKDAKKIKRILRGNKNEK